MTNSGIRHRHRYEDEPQDKYRMLRQWLNILFIIGAIVGVAVFYKYDSEKGTIVIIAAMVLKFIECALRLMK